jgi:predicted tellurium resistance membrane protein TerC
VAVTQILFLGIVFALDSIITAVGMSDHLPVMIAMVVMLVAANPVGDFVNAHPMVKMLALSFLLLVGVALVADGLHFHIPRGYLYFAIAFSALVEGLNLWAAKARRRRPAPHRLGRDRRGAGVKALTASQRPAKPATRIRSRRA